MRLELEAKRFLRAPVVVGVISRVTKNPAAPDWEQILSAGALCQNLTLAANALGYATNWITEWCAYSPGVQAALGLAPSERIAGFIYIGSGDTPPDRERPKLADLITHW
jgi:nitroreductase